jgi:hypothetical protein
MPDDKKNNSNRYEYDNFPNTEHKNKLSRSSDKQPTYKFYNKIDAIS